MTEWDAIAEKHGIDPAKARAADKNKGTIYYQPILDQFAESLQIAKNSRQRVNKVIQVLPQGAPCFTQHRRLMHKILCNVEPPFRIVVPDGNDRFAMSGTLPAGTVFLPCSVELLSEPIAESWTRPRGDYSPKPSHQITETATPRFDRNGDWRVNVRNINPTVFGMVI